jgi:hypothetical protein
LTEKGETAARPGPGILRSGFGAAGCIGIEEYLFRGRQIEEQVSHQKCLRWSMEERYIFVFEA